MAWETRGENGKRYWYDSRRVGGRVRKFYMGDGLLGDTSELMSKLARWCREKRRLDAAEEAERDAVASDAVAKFCAVTDAFLRSILTQAGYHRAGRGPWRRRRGTRLDTQEHSHTRSRGNGEGVMKNCGGGDLAVSDQVEPIEQGAEIAVSSGNAEAIRSDTESAILRLANGDRSAIPAVREAFADSALADRIARTSAALSANAALLELACGKNLLARDLWIREAKQLTENLSGPNPSALESVLIERIVTCRMELNYYLGNYSRAVKAKMAKEGGGFSAPWDDAKQKRMDRAHRRFLSAVKALAQVRRLAMPAGVQAIQINLGNDANDF